MRLFRAYVTCLLQLLLVALLAGILIGWAFAHVQPLRFGSTWSTRHAARQSSTVTAVPARWFVPPRCSMIAAPHLTVRSADLRKVG